MNTKRKIILGISIIVIISLVGMKLGLLEKILPASMTGIPAYVTIVHGKDKINKYMDHVQWVNPLKPPDQMDVRAGGQVDEGFENRKNKLVYVINDKFGELVILNGSSGSTTITQVDFPWKNDPEPGQTHGSVWFGDDIFIRHISINREELFLYQTKTNSFSPLSGRKGNGYDSDTSALHPSKEMFAYLYCSGQGTVDFTNPACNRWTVLFGYKGAIKEVITIPVNYYGSPFIGWDEDNLYVLYDGKKNETYLPTGIPGVETMQPIILPNEPYSINHPYFHPTSPSSIMYILPINEMITQITR